MHSLLHCSWSITTIFAVLFLLLPFTAWGHLGSALRTGSGTLTKFAFGDNVIYCTFNNLGEGKPPVLSHVRVSREPQPHHRILFRNDGFDESSDHTSKIKSPSYQHKILQFHSNGQTSSNGYDYMPLKLITNEYPVYPVASKFGKIDTRRLVGGAWHPTEDDDEDDDGDSWERYSSSRWEPNLLPKSEEPTYTPFLGARALTNIPQFFQHLRDNIHAIHEKHRQSTANNKLETEGAAASDGKGEEDVDKSSETEDIKIATPTRRGYSSNSESALAQDNDDGGATDTDMPNRDSRGSDLYTLANQISNGQTNEEVKLDAKTKELLHFLGHKKQEYLKANNYNPAWLFTNLGLGKRSIGNGDSFYK